MDIKDNIKYILAKRGMNQNDLAQAIGVSRQSIHYYFNGNISLETLQKLAEALNTTVETIVSETPLKWKEDNIPSKSSATETRLICPHCGEEIEIFAK